MSFFSQLKRLRKTEDKTGVSEKTKKRIYDLHTKAEVLFYIDHIYQESNEKVITVIGEWVKGNLDKTSICTFLNCEGLPMKEGKILASKKEAISYSKILGDELKNVLKLRVLDGNLEDVQAAQMLIKSDYERGD